MAPVNALKPLVEPLSKYIVDDSVVISPELVAPILAVILVAGAGPVARSTSSRDITNFTGRAAFCESSTATGSR